MGIRDFKNAHKGGTCVIIGNGPSLDKTPMEKVVEQYWTFGANKIYGKGIEPVYWTCVDKDMLHDCIPWVIENWGESGPLRFIPQGYELPYSYRLNVVVAPYFSTDLEKDVVIGGTVTFVNMQLAYYMGFETVLLVGVDNYYPKSGSNGLPGSKMIAKGDDPDHFVMKDGSPYFTPNRIYNRPETDALTRSTYPMAKQVFEADGRKIINIGFDSQLDVFEKQPFKRWVK